MQRFMTNAKYSFGTWRTKPIQSMFLLLQIISSLIIICFLLTNFFRYGDVIEKINCYMNGENIYTLSDLGTYWQKDETNSDKTLQKYKTIIYSIQESKVKTAFVSTEFLFTDDNDNALNSIQVNENFFDVYDIKVERSIESIEDVFRIRNGNISEQELVSVYLGSDYEKLFDLGDIIKCTSVNLKISGFLGKNQTIVLPMQEKENISTNDMVIIPYYLDENDEDCLQAYIGGLQFIADSKEEMAGIIKVVNEQKINDYYLKNYHDQLKVVKKDYKELFTLFGSMGMIMTIFSGVSIMGMIISISEEKEYEYGISMMCGATKNDIFVRLVLHEVIVFVVGMLIVYSIFGITIASNVVALFSLVCIIIICIFSYNITDVNKIIDAIKNKD